MRFLTGQEVLEYRDALEGLLQRCLYNPFPGITRIDRKNTFRYLYNKFKDLTINSSAIPCLLMDGSEALSLCIINPIKRESRIFGINMVVVSDMILDPAIDSQVIDTFLLHVSDHCMTMDIKHITIRFNTLIWDLITSIEKGGFHLMDTLFVYGLNPEDVPAFPPMEGYAIRDMERGEEEAVSGIVTHAFRDYRYGHFYHDPLLRPHYHEVYLNWTKDALMNKENMVIVVEDNKGICGFLVWTIYGVKDVLGIEVGRELIGGLLPHLRNKRIFQSMSSRGLRQWRGTVHHVEAMVHGGNLRVSNALLGLGARLSDIRYTYHKYLS